MNVTDQEKVCCASFIIKKDARYWWETVAMKRNVNEMTCMDFVGEFNKKFFNMRVINAQQREFNYLKQGTITVNDAVMKFSLLA